MIKTQPYICRRRCCAVLSSRLFALEKTGLVSPLVYIWTLHKTPLRDHNIVIEKPERGDFQRYIETIPPRHRRRFCVNSLLKWNSISPYFYRWFRLDVMGILFPLTLRGFLSDFPLTLWGISVSRFSPYGDFFRQPPPTTPTTSQKSPTTIT